MAAVLFCGASHKAKHVVVNGEQVVEDGRLTRLDERALARKANVLARRMLED